MSNGNAELWGDRFSYFLGNALISIIRVLFFPALPFWFIANNCDDHRNERLWVIVGAVVSFGWGFGWVFAAVYWM